jgi:formylglycine-generating enzyme required for sulfatase activity/energy-coupling factor transporter ATP-binding protein EcfA2
MLLDALGKHQFLAVIGLSGSGKSSLVKCGLIPALEAGYLSGAGTHWHIADFRPGNDPFGSLADSLLEQNIVAKNLANLLRDGGAFSLHEYLAEHPLHKSGKLLLVCDQFEELFRYFDQNNNTDQDAQADAFVALLLASSQSHTLEDGRVSDGIYLVITMRSDFLGECAQFVGLAEAINQGLYLTPRLNREQLRQAIEEPALIAGSEAEPALVVKLLEDVSNNPDQLPLLQHVLMRLWDEGRNLTLKHYRDLGGLSEALNQHADLALGELEKPQQNMARTLFCALTERSEEGKDTRRPLTAGELRAICHTDLSGLTAVVAPFRQAGRNFLMPPPDVALTPEISLDISHESLIRQWKTLQQWVKEEADNAAIYLRLLDAAEHKREKWRGADLAGALEWKIQAGSDALWASRYRKTEPDVQDKDHPFVLAMSFLADSQQAEEDRLKQEESRRQKELKRMRQQRLFLIFGFMMAVLLTAWALYAQNTAKKSQILTVEVTLDNLIRQKAGIESYLQGMIVQGQRATLLKMLQPLLKSSSSLSEQQKQEWQKKLPDVTAERLAQFIRLLFTEKVGKKPDLADFVTLMQEIDRPLPEVAGTESGMVPIPAGSFVMGCKERRDKECFDNEKPAHTVKLAAFELGKYEVTQAQWQAVMNENPGSFQDCGKNCAMESVSWDMIQTFIQKLNARTGKHYRLPSEAEWEYACRAGKDSNYCGGNDAYAVAWYDEHADKHTHVVGHKQANAFGLYDMSGNVWEWVQDCPHNDYLGAPDDGKAWETACPYVGRVLRGGSCFSIPQNSRAANRGFIPPEARYYSNGFRLARTPPNGG